MERLVVAGSAAHGQPTAEAIVDRALAYPRDRSGKLDAAPPTPIQTRGQVLQSCNVRTPAQILRSCNREPHCGIARPDPRLIGVTIVDGRRLEWDHVDAVPIAAEEDLDSVLDEISAKVNDEEAPLVELYAPSGASLAIGVGRDRSIASYIDETLEFPNWHSAGDRAAGHGGKGSTTEFIVFLFRDQHSEFPRGNTISNEDAREAMRRFFRTGKRPDNIEWEMD